MTGGAALVSYECLGTTLTRAVPSQEALLLLLGRRLGVSSPEAFVAARLRAEQVARGRLGARCTLVDVHAELAWATGIERDPAELAEAELSLEARLSRPARGTPELVAPGPDVLFLSDTVLPSHFLAGLLDRHGLLQGREVLVSNELGASKEQGTAYRVVSRRRQVETRRWTHHGHSATSDVARARLAGVTGVLHPAEPLTRYEQVLHRHGAATAGASALLAGASRAARTSAPGADPKQDVAAGVVGPLLTSYVLWSLRQARAAGCERLYFCARDGQVLHRIATVLGPVVAPMIELRYLMGSREAWLVDRDDPLAGELRHVAPEPAEQRLEGLRRHFAAVGLLDDVRSGIVDMASRGNVGRLLAEALQRAGGRAPAVELYFAKASREGQEPGSVRDVRGWLYDDGRERGLRILGAEEYIALEMFATADHGKVTGYDGEGRAVLAPVAPALQQWDFTPVSDTVDRFAAALRDVVDLLPDDVDVREATWAAFLLFWSSPEPGELATWGSFPFEGDDGTVEAPARPVPFGALLGRVARLDLGWRPRGSWPAGARSSSSAPTRLLLSATTALQGRRAEAKRVAGTLAARRALSGGP